MYYIFKFIIYVEWQTHDARTSYYNYYCKSAWFASVIWFMACVRNRSGVPFDCDAINEYHYIKRTYYVWRLFVCVYLWVNDDKMRNTNVYLVWLPLLLIKYFIILCDIRCTRQSRHDVFALYYNTYLHSNI